MTTPAGLFANRNFVRLFAAQVTSLVGSGVTSVALAAFAYELTGRNATAVVGTALALRILAFVVVSPVAGVLADRIDRKRMLIAADVVRVVLLGAFPFITAVWQIYLLIFAVNAVTAFFSPTFEASLPDVVGEKLYTRAISLSRVATDLESVGGPLVAGVLIAFVGVRWAFWFDALTYVVSALLVLGARVPRPARPTALFRGHVSVPRSATARACCSASPRLGRRCCCTWQKPQPARQQSSPRSCTCATDRKSVG